MRQTILVSDEVDAKALYPMPCHRNVVHLDAKSTGLRTRHELDDSDSTNAEFPSKMVCTFSGATNGFPRSVIFHIFSVRAYGILWYPTTATTLMSPARHSEDGPIRYRIPQ